MKRYFPLLFVLFIASCDKSQVGFPNEPTIVYIPFYEQSHDATVLSVQCHGKDSMIDLSTALLPFTEVRELYYQCSEELFNLIPEMTSVELLSSRVITPHLSDAFPNLKTLKLSNIAEFYDGLESIPLENFELEYSFVEMPENITSLTYLTSLHISGNINEPYALPEDLGNLTNLENLRFIHVQDLPSSITQLPNLKSLVVYGSSSNVKPEVPENLGDLTTLTNLELNSVNNIPASIAQLTNLQSIDIRVPNPNFSFPAAFDNMNNLEKLSIFGNVPTATELSIYNAQSLKILEMYGTGITTLLPEIGQLINLESLDLRGNQISTFPATMSNLSNLKYLNCWDMPITEFPMEITGLTNIEYLEFRGCQMTTLPAEIANFTNLKSLRLEANNLTKLPPEIESLKNNLKKLYLSGNNFSNTEKNKIRAWLPNTEIQF